MIVVTGSGGMIGRLVVARLLAAGESVRALVSKGSDGADRTLDRRPLPSPDASDAGFAAALAGARAVVHCAALNTDAARATASDFTTVNAMLTERLARAAAASVPGRFVFLSSIRAVAAPGWSGRIDAATTPLPGCDYGRSKLEAERRLVAAYAGSADLGRPVILRLAPVYGAPLKGSLATLARLADTPLPLPFAGLKARNSLLSADAAVDAVMLALQAGRVSQPIYVASDASPVTLPEVVGALRDGFGRPRRLFSVPEPALRGFGRLFASHVCDPTPLAREGWTPPSDTIAGLRAAARAMRSSPDRS